jgi:hypothetical protein
MRKNVLRTFACALVMAAGVAAVPAASNANAIGYQGCTPGYWKNHTDNWQETSPDKLFSKKYVGAAALLPTQTLGQALNGGGGSGVDGAAKILARAASAAWLNAAHEGLGYPWRRVSVGLDGRPPLTATVNVAFESGDRDAMLALAARLDQDNNLGCPLN